MWAEPAEDDEGEFYMGTEEKRAVTSRLKVCMRCGCELSFTEMMDSLSQLCVICERDEVERDNHRKRQQGNEDEQLGYTRRIDRSLCK